jgi:hypothetical protein
MLERRVDDIENARTLLAGQLKSDDPKTVVRYDESLDPSIPWRPYLFDETHGVAWHILPEYIDSESWLERMKTAKLKKPELSLGVLLPEELLHNHEELLLPLNDLGARIGLMPAEDSKSSIRFSMTIADVIYEGGFRLTSNVAAQVLDRLLERCSQAKTNNQKGVSLEVLAAVMLSQVDGFRVTTVGVSNRTQQIDVRVHNFNVGGILGRGPLVIAEAKNWSAEKPGSSEYSWLFRKIETRFGTSRLGYFVTTDRFTSSMEIERLRDSKGEILVVPLDKDTLPSVWRGTTEKETITKRLEAATIDAASK